MIYSTESMYNNFMQSKQTQRLARQIRKVREKKVNGKLTFWRVVCLTVKPQILKENGEPDTGLACQIAYNGYEPSREIQKRLGLRETCSKCHRAFRKTSAREKRVPSKGRAWWNSLPFAKQEAILGRLYKLEGLL